MINVQKQIDYWITGAAEEWELAVHLLDEKRVRHGLFLCHLAVEKALKAHVCKKTADVAPRVHNLLRLAEHAELTLTKEDGDFLGELSFFNIEGRYPDSYGNLPSAGDVRRIKRETERIYTWLLNQL